MLVISMPFENQNSLTKVITCLPFYLKNEDLISLPIEPSKSYEVFKVKNIERFKKLLGDKAILTFLISHFYFSLNSMFYFYDEKDYILPYSPIDFYIYTCFNMEAPEFVLERMKSTLDKCFSILPREVKILYIGLPRHLLDYKQLLQDAYSQELYEFYREHYKINIEFVKFEEITNIKF